jgi:phosphatidylcholine synthase
MNARLAAWGVHLYTASGVVVALLALAATSRGAHGTAFAWLTVAFIIDCTDGTLARRARVKQVLPYFDGSKLDDIIDYLTYVFVPVVIACRAHLLPDTLAGITVAALPLLGSAYGFCRTDAKTADHFFTGFPSYWNVVVFYLYVLRAPIWFNVAVLVFFSAMVFVPIRYLYPSRMPTERSRAIVLGVVWFVLVLFVLRDFPTPPRWLVILSLFYPAYYVLISLRLHFTSPPSPPAPDVEVASL